MDAPVIARAVSIEEGLYALPNNIWVGHRDSRPTREHIEAVLSAQNETLIGFILQDEPSTFWPGQQESLVGIVVSQGANGKKWGRPIHRETNPWLRWRAELGEKRALE